MPLTENEIQSKLLRVFETAFPSTYNIEMRDFVKLTDGWETEVFAFAIAYGATAQRTHEDLILRMYPGDDAHEKSEKEFNAIGQLHKAGYAVPQVMLLEQDATILGKPFLIMQKIDGRPLGNVIAESSDERKQALLDLFCKLYIELHTLDWRPFVPDSLSFEKENPIEAWLESAQEMLHHFQTSEFDPALDWLRERAAEIQPGRISILHWDYHQYNVLLTKDDDAFVIDWGGIEVGDFRFDLAWTLLLSSTYGSPEMRDILLDKYRHFADYAIEQIEYFEVAACVRRLFSISASLGEGADKLGMRPEAVEQMKGSSAHIANVHARLQDLAGISVPAIETLLLALSS